MALRVRLISPPYPTGPGSLFVAYYASAELGCHLALGWPLPARVLDLYAEFKAADERPAVAVRPRPARRPDVRTGSTASRPARRTTCAIWCCAAGHGRTPSAGRSWTTASRDVDALAELLPRMAPAIVGRRHGLATRSCGAATRRRSPAWSTAASRSTSRSCARSGATGRTSRRSLVAEVDHDFGVYDGQTFKLDRFAGFLAREGIPWPRLDSGQLALDDDTFREMARTYPRVAPLRELRHAMGQLRLNDLAVGPDGRNRTLLSPFGASTGRNTPSNAKFIFGPAVWLRGLIRPDPGRALAYIDYSAQEVGIAAALSGDPAMLEAVRSGDPYLGLAKQAGRAPADATKDSHGPLRDVFKVVVLGTGYGMEEDSLACRLGTSPVEARDLLAMLRRTWPTFWRWSEAAVDHAMLHGHLDTVFGWRLHVGAERQPALPAQLPVPGERRRDAAPGLLPGHRARRRRVRAGARRGADRGRPGPDRRGRAYHQGGHGRGVSAWCSAASSWAPMRKLIFWPKRYADRRGEVMWRRVLGILDGLERRRAA